MTDRRNNRGAPPGQPPSAPTPASGSTPAGRSGNRGFDFDAIDNAIGDLVGDVPEAAPVNPVQLPPGIAPRPVHPEVQRYARGFAPTDEHLPVGTPATEPQVSAIGAAPAYPQPARVDPRFAAPVYPAAAHPAAAHPAAAHPAAAHPAAAHPAAAQPVAAQPVAAHPAAAQPVAAPARPVARPIQNVETAFVRNPLLGPRPPRANAAPVAPAAPMPQPVQPAPLPQPGHHPGSMAAPGPNMSTGAMGRVAPLPRGKLVVSGGEWNGTTWYLNRAETRLGRGEDNDIVLLDIGVSRQHLLLARHSQGFRLIDLGSGNGTYVNERRISEAELFDGDTIDLGHSSLVFSTMGTPRVRPAADPTAPGGYPAQRRSLPATWLAAMALTTFLTVLGTMYIVKLVRTPEAPTAPATDPLDAVQVAIADRDWSQARTALEQADGADADAKARLAKTIEREAGFARLIEHARAAVDSGESPEKIDELLGPVPPDSAYAGDARKLRATARAAVSARMLDEAEALLAAGKTALAKVKVEQVLGGDAGNQRARGLLRRIEAAE